MVSHFTPFVDNTEAPLVSDTTVDTKEGLETVKVESDAVYYDEKQSVEIGCDVKPETIYKLESACKLEPEDSFAVETDVICKTEPGSP